MVLAFPWVTLQEQPRYQLRAHLWADGGEDVKPFARYGVVFRVSFQLSLLISHSSIFVFMHED